MSLDTESLVRQRAYEIWESENRPHGRDKEHWERALREVSAATPAVKPPAKATAKSAEPVPAKPAASPKPAPAAMAKRRKPESTGRPSRLS